MPDESDMNINNINKAQCYQPNEAINAYIIQISRTSLVSNMCLCCWQHCDLFIFIEFQSNTSKSNSSGGSEIDQQFKYIKSYLFISFNLYFLKTKFFLLVINLLKQKLIINLKNKCKRELIPYWIIESYKLA